jgi:branched-subunit amino acid ABC-type transport system permease component
VLTIVQNLLAIIYGSVRVFVNQDLLESGPGNFWRWGDLTSVLVALFGYASLEILLRKTSVGARFRAMAEDPALLRTLGMGVRRYTVLAFVIGSVLMAGCAVVSVYMQGANPNDGFTIGTFAIAAMIVGGVGNYTGALLGGIILGIAEGASLYWIAAAWQQAIGFGILLVILLVRPRGIFAIRMRTIV